MEFNVRVENGINGPGTVVLFCDDCNDSWELVSGQGGDPDIQDHLKKFHGG